MSPASYQTAPPRDVSFRCPTPEPILRPGSLSRHRMDLQYKTRLLAPILKLRRPPRDFQLGPRPPHPDRQVRLLESERRLCPVERETGLEPATPTLARLCSTN